MFRKYFKCLDYKINRIEYSKLKLILNFLFLFKYEFIPNKKIFNNNFDQKNKIKNTKFYMVLKYVFYFIINLISYPKNIINVIKIIILSKHD